MKSLLVLFIWCIIIPGCGAEYSSENATVDPRLIGYLAEWELDCRSTARDISKCNTRTLESISVVDKYEDEETVGKCTISWRGFTPVRRITLKREMLDSANIAPYTFRALVLHEMLHCRFGFEAHTASGIMAPYLMRERELERNWPELLREAYAAAE